MNFHKQTIFTKHKFNVFENVKCSTKTYTIIGYLSGLTLRMGNRHEPTCIRCLEALYNMIQ